MQFSTISLTLPAVAFPPLGHMPQEQSTLLVYSTLGNLSYGYKCFLSNLKKGNTAFWKPNTTSEILPGSLTPQIETLLSLMILVFYNERISTDCGQGLCWKIRWYAVDQASTPHFWLSYMCPIEKLFLHFRVTK